MYQSAIDLDDVTAIDMHVHIEVDDHGHTSLPEPLVAAASAYFRDGRPTARGRRGGTVLPRARMAAVVFTVDARTQLEHAISRPTSPARRPSTPMCSSRSAGLSAHRGSGPRTADRLIEERAYAASSSTPRCRASIPASESTSRCGGAPGAGRRPGALSTPGRPASARATRRRRSAARPVEPDAARRVAADFPDLQDRHGPPVGALAGRGVSVAMHKHNTWIDLSGWSPSTSRRAGARTPIDAVSDRVLFGTDFPMLTPDRWLRDVQTRLKPEVLPGILKENAARLLGLAGDDERKRHDDDHHLRPPPDSPAPISVTPSTGPSPRTG